MYSVSHLYGGMKYSTMFFAYEIITPLPTVWILSSGMVCLEHVGMWRMEWGFCSGNAILLSLYPGCCNWNLCPCRWSDGSTPKGNVAPCAIQIAPTFHRWSAIGSPLTMQTSESNQLYSTEAMLLWEKDPACQPAPLIPVTQRQDRLSLPSFTGF